MNIISPIEVFLALFIGMGPVKVLLIYIAKTQGMDKEIKRKMARRIAIVAAGVANGVISASLSAAQPVTCICG